MTGQITVRPADVDDTGFIYSMVEALAEYEGEPDQVTGTIEQLRDSLFGADPVASGLIAEVAGEPVGMAVYYRTFSTWECVPGIWLEDIFVKAEYRRRAREGQAGIGESLLRAVAEVTVERGYTRLEWVALDWNTPALSFYRKQGAERMDEWLVHRLAGSSLQAIAGPQLK